MKHCTQRGVLALALAVGLLAATGCGSPGVPQAPSLNLPDKVLNLTAERNGNIVLLAWTMPRRNTDHILLKGPLTVHLCRKSLNDPCVFVADLNFNPGVSASFRETLPSELTLGPPRLLAYFVEVRNRNGRSVGLSNQASTAAGKAPPPLTGFTAQPQSTGVLFRWQPLSNEAGQQLRLHRTLLGKSVLTTSQHIPGSDLDSKEPASTTLIADITNQAQALDASALPDRLYSYTADRLDRLTLDGKSVDLAGPETVPIRVDTKDVFPPNSPVGLVAIANDAEHSLDLSWSPNTEPDLAGYFVYRKQADGKWQRVSGDKPLAGSAWRDLTPPAGVAVGYAVTAIDFSGNESARSATITSQLP